MTDTSLFNHSMLPGVRTTKAWGIQRRGDNIPSRSLLFIQETKWYTILDINLYWSLIASLIEFHSKSVRQIEQIMLYPFYKSINRGFEG